MPPRLEGGRRVGKGLKAKLSAPVLYECRHVRYPVTVAVTFSHGLVLFRRLYP